MQCERAKVDIAMCCYALVIDDDDVWRIADWCCCHSSTQYMSEPQREPLVAPTACIIPVPPMLAKNTSASRIGSGAISITLHKRIVTGAINRIVVTLSRNADRTAVRQHRIIVKYQMLPRDSLYARTAEYSKKPVLAKMPTMIIMPNNNPTVSKSIQDMTSSNVGRA
jgi:hypothetical protein